VTAITRVYLIRHGSVVGAETRRFIGHLDVPLSPAGEAQCRALGARLMSSGIRALYCSDLARARRSGELVGQPSGLRPVLVPPLREMSMGRWDGLTADQIRAREPAAFAAWVSHIGRYQFPAGESVPDLARRVWPAFLEIVDAHAGESIAVVAHGGTNRAILCCAVDLGFDRLMAFGQDYAALTILERTGGGAWSVRCVNEPPT
jgi:broad specificity phosphatase PhoE